MAAGAIVFLALGTVRASDIDAEPIHYSTTRPDNPVERLRESISSGQVKFEFDEDHGYLRSVLRALNIPESSQTLVFSKTSLQRHRIGPKTPRALYFNDDIYIGFCLRGDVIEVSAADAHLGSVFYTLDQHPGTPKFTRQTDSCLICHGSSPTQGFPGHLVRSLRADSDGMPILSAGSYRTDHASPFRERWGGWYVTGTSGHQLHMGNQIVRDKRGSAELDLAAGSNVTDLSDRFTVGLYPTPHSDIVALMVLEHQTEAHNRITRANFQTRIAMRDATELNKALGKPADHQWDSTASRIRSACEPLVKYLLMSGEPALTDPVHGTSAFAREFAANGPRDRHGRSLRELDLEKRLFKYPCSFLIDTAAFDGLPLEAKEYVFRRLWEVLTGKDTSADFAHLTPEDRRAVREILLDTKADLPAYWHADTEGH
ncbi:MAG TPA: hypothetical protein VL371_19655 [Gemmataceae bacterium]|nr:hypothetical protein [Gemmataceae bacterium]